MSKDIVTAFFEYATTYDKLLALVGSILIIAGLIGGVGGKIIVMLSPARQFIIALIGLVIISIPILPLIFRDITLQELKALKFVIDGSKYELDRYHDPNGGPHPLYLRQTIDESQKRIDILIAKKEGNR